MRTNTRVLLTVGILIVLLGLSTLGCGKATSSATMAPVTASAVPAATTHAGTGLAGTSTPTSGAGWESYKGQQVSVVLERPAGWVAAEEPGRVVLAEDEAALAGAELEGASLVVTRIEGATTAEAALAQVSLPGAREQRRESTTIGGEPASLLEVEVISEVSGRAYRLLAVGVAHGGQAYLLLASAPAEQWDEAGPVLQKMLADIAFSVG